MGWTDLSNRKSEVWKLNMDSGKCLERSLAENQSVEHPNCPISSSLVLSLIAVSRNVRAHAGDGEESTIEFTL